MLQKINNIKCKLMKVSKSAENAFQKYKYVELSDIYKILIPALNEENIYMELKFREDELELYLKDIDSKKVIVSFLKYPKSRDAGSIKNPFQAEGAGRTYMTRGILTSFFNIAIPDEIDSQNGDEKVKLKDFKDNDREAIIELLNKGIKPKEIADTTPGLTLKEVIAIKKSINKQAFKELGGDY